MQKSPENIDFTMKLRQTTPEQEIQTVPIVVTDSKTNVHRGQAIADEVIPPSQTVGLEPGKNNVATIIDDRGVSLKFPAGRGHWKANFAGVPESIEDSSWNMKQYYSSSAIAATSLVTSCCTSKGKGRLTERVVSGKVERMEI